MTLNENQITSLPFYTDTKYQDRNKWWVDNVYRLISPNNKYLPFQIIKSDLEMEMCIIPAGMYTVAEIPPAGIVPGIVCTEAPTSQTPTSVTVDIGDGDEVACTFTNEGAAEIKITKLTVPPSTETFEFTSTGFAGLPDCEITDAFTLNNQQMATCQVSTGMFTITETVPQGQVLNILCDALPAVFNVDEATSTLGFTINDLTESVDCTFINSFANVLVNVLDEPPGVNCAEGGIRIETGPDTNQNGMLDPNEVTDTFFICNGDPGAPGPEGPEGPEAKKGYYYNTPRTETAGFEVTVVIRFVPRSFIRYVGVTIAARITRNYGVSYIDRGRRNCFKYPSRHT